MKFQKLFKSAGLIRRSNPVLADEIVKIAQDLSTLQAADAGVPANPVQNVAQPADGTQNPLIKNFGNPPSQEESVTHRLTFTLTAPKNLDELEIMNELLPVLKNFQQTNSSVEIKGYQFTQS